MTEPSLTPLHGGRRGLRGIPDAHYELLFEHIPVGLYRTSPDGRFLDVNAALVDLLGFASRDDLLAVNATDLYVRPMDRLTWLHMLTRDGQVRDHEAEIRRADGRVIWVRDSAHATRGPDGRLLYCSGALQDVTERRQANEMLRRSEERFLLAARATKDTLWDWDFATDDIWWSEGMATQYGYRPHESGGFQWWTGHIHDDDRERVAAGIYAVVNGGGQSWADEYRFRRADGSWAQLYDRGYVLRDADGRPVRMIGAMMDISERAELEGQLRQAAKMEAIGRLAGGIAHDFNNLLTAILGQADLVLGDLPVADPRRAAVEEIGSSAQRAATLTQQLLAFSRKQQLRLVQLDCNSVVEAMQTMLRRLIGEHVRLETALADGLASVTADRSQLEQVIVNLVVNARDAMPAGGVVRLATATVPAAEAAALRLRDLGPGDHVRISVVDQGVGMSPETLARVFEPFFTTKDVGKGTGLGLATVYGIVKQCGGTIAVHSTIGGGTTFEVYLPAATGAPKAVGDGATGERPRGTEAVLLVEDEAAVRRLARTVLARQGYTVHEAADAGVAQRLSAEHPGPIHLLVTDVVMPGMRGDELAERLVRERPGLKVLYISGYAGGELPGTAFLAKPFTPDVLARRVREVLDG